MSAKLMSAECRVPSAEWLADRTRSAAARADALGTRHSALGTRIAAVALGSNLGDRAGTIRAAVGRIGALGLVRAVSPLYETPAWPDPAGPAYLNAALVLETGLGPVALLAALLEIERELGRERFVRNAPRTIDLDLLLVDDLAIATPDLILPHPRLHERAFVLAPLADVAPAAVHPRLGRSVRDLLATLPPDEVRAVRRWLPAEDRRR